MVGGANASQGRLYGIQQVLRVVKVDCWSLERVMAYEPSWISSLLDFMGIFQICFWKRWCIADEGRVTQRMPLAVSLLGRP